MITRFSKPPVIKEQILDKTLKDNRQRVNISINSRWTHNMLLLQSIFPF